MGIFSNKTTHEGIDCHNFAVSHDLTQIIDFPTRIPDVEHHFQYILDLFLSSTPELFQSFPNTPLGTSDHLVVTVNINLPQKQSTDVPFHRTVYRYNQADWDTFRSYLADAPTKSFFKHHASKAAKLVSDWIAAGSD